MDTGLLTKENQFIPIPYYEIGTFAENVCNQYITENEINKIHFDIFAQDYNFFKPYLDFLLFELGYKMINPLLYQNAIWFVENDILTLKQGDNSSKYSKVSDVALDISYVNPENVRDCMMDSIGRVYNVNRESNLYHENICDLVINQYLIYDKELYEMYKEYMSAKTRNITAFAKNMLGFSRLVMLPDQSGAVEFCSELHNSYSNAVFKRIKELYPKFDILPYNIHTKESLSIANKCIERVGDMNENRRLRF